MKLITRLHRPDLALVVLLVLMLSACDSSISPQPATTTTVATTTTAVTTTTPTTTTTVPTTTTTVPTTTTTVSTTTTTVPTTTTTTPTTTTTTATTTTTVPTTTTTVATTTTTTTIPAFAADFTVPGNSASNRCQVDKGGGGILLACTFDGSASGPGTVNLWEYRFGSAGSTVKFSSTSAMKVNPVVTCGDSSINAVPDGTDFSITVFLTATPATGPSATTSKLVFFHRAGAC